MAEETQHIELSGCLPDPLAPAAGAAPPTPQSSFLVADQRGAGGEHSERDGERPVSRAPRKRTRSPAPPHTVEGRLARRAGSDDAVPLSPSPQAITATGKPTPQLSATTRARGGIEETASDGTDVRFVQPLRGAPGGPAVPPSPHPSTRARQRPGSGGQWQRVLRGCGSPAAGPGGESSPTGEDVVDNAAVESIVGQQQGQRASSERAEAAGRAEADPTGGTPSRLTSSSAAASLDAARSGGVVSSRAESLACSALASCVAEGNTEQLAGVPALASDNITPPLQSEPAERTAEYGVLAGANSQNPSSAEVQAASGTTLLAAPVVASVTATAAAGAVAQTDNRRNGDEEEEEEDGEESLALIPGATTPAARSVRAAHSIAGGAQRHGEGLGGGDSPALDVAPSSSALTDADGLVQTLAVQELTLCSGTAETGEETMTGKHGPVYAAADRAHGANTRRGAAAVGRGATGVIGDVHETEPLSLESPGIGHASSGPPQRAVHSPSRPGLIVPLDPDAETLDDGYYKPTSQVIAPDEGEDGDDDGKDAHEDASLLPVRAALQSPHTHWMSSARPRNNSIVDVAATGATGGDVGGTSATNTASAPLVSRPADGTLTTLASDFPAPVTTLRGPSVQSPLTESTALAHPTTTRAAADAAAATVAEGAVNAGPPTPVRAESDKASATDSARAQKTLTAAAAVRAPFPCGASVQARWGANWYAAVTTEAERNGYVQVRWDEDDSVLHLRTREVRWPRAATDQQSRRRTGKAQRSPHASEKDSAAAQPARKQDRTERAADPSGGAPASSAAAAAAAERVRPKGVSVRSPARRARVGEVPPASPMTGTQLVELMDAEDEREAHVRTPPLGGSVAAEQQPAARSLPDSQRPLLAGTTPEQHRGVVATQALADDDTAPLSTRREQRRGLAGEKNADSAAAGEAGGLPAHRDMHRGGQVSVASRGSRSERRGREDSGAEASRSQERAQTPVLLTHRRLVADESDREDEGLGETAWAVGGEPAPLSRVLPPVAVGEDYYFRLPAAGATAVRSHTDHRHSNSVAPLVCLGRVIAVEPAEDAEVTVWEEEYAEVSAAGSPAGADARQQRELRSPPAAARVALQLYETKYVAMRQNPRTGDVEQQTTVYLGPRRCVVPPSELLFDTPVYVISASALRHVYVLEEDEGETKGLQRHASARETLRISDESGGPALTVGPVPRLDEVGLSGMADWDATEEDAAFGDDVDDEVEGVLGWHAHDAVVALDREARDVTAHRSRSKREEEGVADTGDGSVVDALSNGGDGQPHPMTPLDGSPQDPGRVTAQPASRGGAEGSPQAADASATAALHLTRAVPPPPPPQQQLQQQQQQQQLYGSAAPLPFPLPPRRSAAGGSVATPFTPRTGSVLDSLQVKGRVLRVGMIVAFRDAYSRMSERSLSAQSVRPSTTPPRTEPPRDLSARGNAPMGDTELPGGSTALANVEDDTQHGDVKYGKVQMLRRVNRSAVIVVHTTAHNSVFGGSKMYVITSDMILDVM